MRDPVRQKLGTGFPALTPAPPVQRGQPQELDPATPVLGVEFSPRDPLRPVRAPEFLRHGVAHERLESRRRSLGGASRAPEGVH